MDNYNLLYFCVEFLLIDAIITLSLFCWTEKEKEKDTIWDTYRAVSLTKNTVEPRFNEVTRYRANLFVKWRVRYIENLDITNLRGEAILRACEPEPQAASRASFCEPQRTPAKKSKNGHNALMWYLYMGA